MNAARHIGDIDTLYRIPLITDGPWFFAPVQLGTPAQTFHLMLDTGSSLSWIQTTDCQGTPQLCNSSPKFDTALSSTLAHQPEMIAVRYTEGIIRTRLASDIVILGAAPSASVPIVELTAAAGAGINTNNNSSDTSAVSNSTTSGRPSSTLTTTTAMTTATVALSDQQRTPTSPTYINEASSIPPTGTNESQETTSAADVLAKLRQNASGSTSIEATRFRGQRTFGLTTDISGDAFLLAKETKVPGFLGASQGRFESDSAFTGTWGTLTLGGPDPIFHSQPITWINTLKGEAGWVTHLSSHIDIYPNGANPKTTPETETDFVRTNLDRVWFDSGTTYIWGDERAVRPLNDWMGADPVTGQVNCSTIPSLGKIVFSIGGTEDRPLLRLELNPSEYIIGKPTSRRCFTALNISASTKNHWIFGLHVMRAFYTVYHYEYGLIGLELSH
ncbi:MAG: aspartic peptidase domain-containing protein [Linnemannia gamsii]|nr:MAG: aspartic peptidase domain-containing protein [Linnemannia gamsii]